VLAVSLADDHPIRAWLDELAQPSPPAPAVESSIEEPASTSVAESEPAVVSPADPDQEARGRTVAAGAAPTAGAPDAPSESQDQSDTISPPPVHDVSSLVGEREGGDFALEVWDRAVAAERRAEAAELRASTAEQDRDDYRRAVAELEVAQRQLEAQHRERLELIERAFDEAAGFGVPDRSWPIEARAGAVAGLFRRMSRQRRS
jgi:hypothetical protein